MRLVNWIWLEDLLVRACEDEIRLFAFEHDEAPVYACCLEFDAFQASILFSYAVRSEIEAQVTGAGAAGPAYYRNLELDPVHWRWRRLPLGDPEGAWEPTRDLLDRCRENLQEAEEVETVRFYWVRFEYLVRSVVRRLIDREAVRYFQHREEPFLLYSAHEGETVEALEDRLADLYPGFQRASFEWSDLSRRGSPRAQSCRKRGCRFRDRSELLRCTACGTWRCPDCAPGHKHPELRARRPFFATLGLETMADES